MSWVKKLSDIDTRIVFFLVLASLVVPMYFPLALPMSITERTKVFYNLIENLEPGSVVGFGMDASVGGYPEARPTSESVIYQMLRMDVKIVFWSMSVDGQILLDQAFKEIGGIPSDKIYGKDYVYLGYISGGETGLAALARDIHSLVSTDFYGNPLSELEIFDDVNGAEDMVLVMTNTTANDILEGYVRQWVTPYGIKYAVITLAIMSPSAEPYYPDQIVAMTTTQRQGAEYEMLVGKPGYGVQAMDIQNMTHLLLLVFLIIGNGSALYLRLKGESK